MSENIRSNLKIKRVKASPPNKINVQKLQGKQFKIKIYKENKNSCKMPFKTA